QYPRNAISFHSILVMLSPAHRSTLFPYTTLFRSESLYDTDQFSLMSDNWQFESGLVPDDTISYNHTRTNFEIFNGSSDTINPRMRHRLKIYIQLNAKNGFRLVNKTTGDIFDYKRSEEHTSE